MRLHLRDSHAQTALFSTIVACIAGCARWGGEVLRDNHVAFNTSVAQAMDRQMLLNIVRLSRDEPTQWMTVSAINVNTSVGITPAGTATIPSNGLVSGTAGGAANFNYTPNITFVPRQGEQLANELMSPIPVTSIERMVSSSWPISWIVFLSCERVQEIDSFDVTSGYGIYATDPNFGRLMQLFDAMQKTQGISLSQMPVPFAWNRHPIVKKEVTLKRLMEAKRENASLIPREDGGFDFVSIEPAPVLTVYPGAETQPEGKELLKLLQVGHKSGNWRVVSLEHRMPGQYITVRTRSLQALLRLLSFGVDTARDAPPPPTDVDSPEELWKLMIENSGDNAVDLSQYVDAVFRVHRSTSEPAEAAVSVFYQGDCYWISSRDTTARRVFALVRDLFDLQVEAKSETSPVLTVPVGR
ncbi:MAG: hypothetical protein FJ292_06260 [Planctomycetes bacterium]|nr:hypothetical protein [Planctomycetota bacterium]